MNLHDADEVVGYIPPRAHSLRDELYEPRKPIEPIVGGSREVREVVAGMAVLLLLGVAFWLLFAIAVASQVTL